MFSSVFTVCYIVKLDVHVKFIISLVGSLIDCIAIITAEVLKSLSPANDENDEDTKRKLASLAQHESIVNQYKELIREQVRIAH